ncbi:hypothetical protein [Streptomyces sp. SID12501]|uniref:Uncharacterized protein n=1 Tax=Streptomyces sp. SID12501 TaxID=2706042 RepID=A0A6B3BH18_9ACTN|nr:hypothetical protein [Streptomyces sp. SID12501]NEC85050.1 hypothetical protein [Streptomyces sp. SID12501]
MTAAERAGANAPSADGMLRAGVAGMLIPPLPPLAFTLPPELSTAWASEVTTTG